MTLDARGGALIKDSDSLWSGRNLHDLYKQAYALGMASSDHGRARDLGLIALVHHLTSLQLTSCLVLMCPNKIASLKIIIYAD